jgi:hypothetical protein
MTDKPKHDLKNGIDLAALTALQKPRTAEQQARYELVTECSRRIQEGGLKQPASGTWGKPAK